MNELRMVSKVPSVGIITLDNMKEINNFLFNKVQEYGAVPISICTNELYSALKEVKNFVDILIVSGDDIDAIRGKAIEEGFHQVFWKVHIENTETMFIGFNSRKYIIGFAGDIVVLEDILLRKLKDTVLEIKLTNGDKYINKKDSTYSLWGKR